MAARGEVMTYTCPHCTWSLSEPTPAEYPDTEQGRDDLAADYAYFELEKEQHHCLRQLIKSLAAPREECMPL